MNARFKVFIQARMSSSRFPGKVLAPLCGDPVIAHLIKRVARVIPLERVVLATSEEFSDDPLANYVSSLGVAVFRGPLNDVFTRFRMCLAEYPCDWFFRICADSPLFDESLISTMMLYVDQRNVDLVTNVQKRTFPHGHSSEMICARTFSKIDPTRLSDDEREHVTKFYYSHPTEFKILNLENKDATYGDLNFTVDTIEDLRRLEEFLRRGVVQQHPNIIVPDALS